MKLELGSMEKALAQLEKSLAYLDSELARGDPDLRAQFRAAAIQAFEFTYELTVKMIRRRLEQVSINPAELREIAFPDLIRLAAEAGLVRDVEPFRVYREMRNTTSHAYDERRAERVLAGLPDFLLDARFALEALRERNGDACD